MNWWYRMGTESGGSIASQLPCTFFVQRPIRLSPLTPSESQAIAHSPHVCHWASLLGTFTEPRDWLSCFQALVKKNARKPKWYTSPSMTPHHPRTGRLGPWKWNNGIWQNWGKKGLSRQTRLPNQASQLLACMAWASYHPSPSLVSLCKMGTQSAYLGG